MPLDASIILANANPERQYDPVKSMAQAAAAQQQVLQVQQAQQSMADAAAFKQQYGMSPGMAQAHQKMALAEKEKVEAEAKAQKAKIEALNAFNQKQLGIYNTIKDEASYQAALPVLTANAQVMGLDTTKSDHPPAFDHDFVATKKAQMLSFDQQLKQRELELKELELNNFSGFHGAIGPDNKPGVFQQNKKGEVRQVPGLKPVPNQAAIMVGGGQLTPEAMAMLVQKYKDTGQLDADIGRNPVLRAQIVNAAAKDGPVDLASAKQGYTATTAGKKDFEPNGTSGKTISAINTMTEHLATARRMADALQNGQFPIANKAAQALGIQLGQDQATNFATIKQFLAGEVARVATGGHITEGEIKLAAERLGQAQSPAQLMGALDTMREVAAGKLIAIDQDHKRLFGRSMAETGRLTPATKSAFQSVAGAHAPASGLPKIASPQDPAFASLKKGDHFIGPDGKERVKN